MVSMDIVLRHVTRAIFARDHALLLLHKKVKFPYIVRTPFGGASRLMQPT
jgi:hypothetical protein